MLDDVKAQHQPALETNPPNTQPPLDQYAQKIASKLAPVNTVEGQILPVFKRLQDLNVDFQRIHNYFAQPQSENGTTTYAREWLLDNFYLVQRTLRQVEEDMPTSFYQELPKLDAGEFVEYPRIYVLARELTAYEGIQAAQNLAQDYLKAIQQTLPLKMGELWAWPVMLRVIVLENLYWALQQIVETKAADISPVATYVLEFVQRRLKDKQEEPRLLVANSITILRHIDTCDWQDFFESVSIVEAILRQDPAQVYHRMDFVTRNRYRSAIEELANKAKQEEEIIAQTVLKIAEDAASSDINLGSAEQDLRRAHVGYYLLDRGYRHLLKQINYLPFQETFRLWLREHFMVQAYLGLIFAFSLLIVLLLFMYAVATGGTLLQFVLTAIFGFIPVSAAVIHILNWSALQVVKPANLPKLDFSEGVPEDCRTVVVIPALLSHASDIDSLVEQLELHYLRNTDPQLRFALLADFSDAPQETMPEDQALIEAGKVGIDKLNRRYGTRSYLPFYLFLRRRLWNPAENTWMGYERKRGKLSEFNQFLLVPDSETTYFVQHGDLRAMADIRYVITLDADTVMPNQSAHRLIGTLAHPLNKALFDENKERVIAGYTILQPRVELLPNVQNTTIFARIMGGSTGFDLYTLAVSDIYQDLFGEGIYVGKGIYDVAAFERSVAGRIPDNALLSHDLFEGIHGRAGLVTDIVLVEDYPTHYSAYILRMHRWIRGDWQLLPWLSLWVPTYGGAFERNRLTTLSVWKVFDNLRRSLERPAVFALLIAGWLVLPGSPYVWTVVGLLVMWVPFAVGMVSWIRTSTVSEQATSVQEVQLNLMLTRWGLTLAFLPYESLIIIDAILRTLFRLVRGKRLLEWSTAASISLLFEAQSSVAMWRQMAGSVVTTMLLALAILFIRPSSLLPATPLLVLWILAPYFADRLNQQAQSATSVELADADYESLRKLARRTWLFFEAFVSASDHWLPPDNYQSQPPQGIKSYTSPTNIGLMLISTLAAYDMGYIGLLDFVLRVRFAFDSINQLDRYRGHLLNWSDTRTLKPLAPRYVSTVDSGNYAGCLLALKEGCADLQQMPVVNKQRWQGLLDTLDVMHDIQADLDISDDSDGLQRVHTVMATIRQIVEDTRHQPLRWGDDLNVLINQHGTALNSAIGQLIEEMGSQQAKVVGDLHIYSGRLRHQLSSIQRDVETLLPWLILFQDVPKDIIESGKEWESLQSTLVDIPRLSTIHIVYQQAQDCLNELVRHIQVPEAQVWCKKFTNALAASEASVSDLLRELESTQTHIEAEISDMDFGFLYNSERHLFHIGYNVEEEKNDPNHYDLLASEARLASYIAIAKGDVPYKHWLHLGRPITVLAKGQTLTSWSGTMFEYLMPILLMRQEANTLLTSSTLAAVDSQIAYGSQHNTPWGISESGYYVLDLNTNYQYRAFGVPDLALKRGQELDHVIAPYASVLALPLRPARVVENLRQLLSVQALDTYGLIEAIDYTISRLPLGMEHALVQEYMAHHQGMILISLVNFLQQNVMVERFHRNPRIKSIELLLGEQIPAHVSENEDVSQESTPEPLSNAAIVHPWEVDLDTNSPQAHYLSNGRYKVMITSGGAGYSEWSGRALTRWRADTTLDNWGTWLYVRDDETGELWSGGYQPVGGDFNQTKAIFHPHKAEFTRQEPDMSIRMEIVVSSSDDFEVRQIALINHSDKPRRLTVCSYSELVMAVQSGDQRHQAFNKMFVESDYLPDLQTLLFRRRLRSENDEPLVVAHRLIGEQSLTDPQYETDRMRFLGRNNTVAAPHALTGKDGLSGIIGATLDPIMAMAHTVEVQPYTTLTLAYLTFAGSDESQVLDLVRQHSQWDHIRQVFDQARYRVQRELDHLELDSTTLSRMQILLSSLLYPSPGLRAPSAILSANTQSQSGLWAYGISGDYPIVLLEIGEPEQMGLVRELILAHTLWRNRGIKSTLVILNMHDTGYEQKLYHQLHTLISRLRSEVYLNRHDGIFVLRSEQLNDTDRTLLRTAARVVLDGKLGSLGDQISHMEHHQVNLPAFIPTLDLAEIGKLGQAVQRPDNLLFDNGYGGFSPDGHEYVMYVTPDHPTPAPWSNVIANEVAGFIVTESGGTFTWAHNSGENRLTAWRNDPVTDMPAEVVYIRDEETGAMWSPTPMPAGCDQPVLVRHGAGYSVFEHNCYGIEQRMRVYMSPEDPVKFVRVHLKNTSSRPRRLTLTYYAEWVIGPTKDVTQQYLIPSFDSDAQTVTVRNPYSLEFGDYHAFLTTNTTIHGLTTDRTEFLGRMASYRQPAGLRRIGLSNTVKAGIDPCAALQVHVDLESDGEAEICFILGQGVDRQDALQLSRKYRQQNEIDSAWESNCHKWRDLLDSIVVRTPDAAMNTLIPWLLYQSLACRIWGRSALYQSSGAYGFRDQLQDVMSLIHVRPDITRSHILEAARHQFEAGDVLHWWHPPSGRGVRTHFADDLLWLPFVTAHYIRATGDEGILSEEVPFLKGDPLRPNEEERYGLYESTQDTYTLYEHCRRALEKGYTRGRHNLPLMKAGDWNDGMNRVGVHGRGESVWMAWFLYSTMNQFLELCGLMNDDASALTYRSRMASLQEAIEAEAWDGKWYLRAYYDSGVPLGSSESEECQIDSLAQSWAVLSGAADPKRAAIAMQSVDNRLVQEENGLVQLFDPPFDDTPHDPGYIKGYPPGIRENGGQYTHAALWYVWALAQMGQGHRAEELFRLLNPIYHGDSQTKAEHYRVEPYVVAADVYSVPPHTGRGGWTWYTGSAGWMYRLGIEAILGLYRNGATLEIEPRISRDWSHYEVEYQYGSSRYHIRVENPNRSESGIARIWLDDVPEPIAHIPLQDDGKKHSVIIEML